MSRRHAVPPLAALAAAACAVALWPAGGSAASTTQTLRVFDKPVSLKITHPDGGVADSAPFPAPKAGDILDVNSLDYRGDHKRHSARPIGSTHLRCTFGDGPPACESHVAIGGSLLVFTGNPGKLTDGTGRFQGATGRVVSSKEVPGQENASDIVARIRLGG